MKTNINALWKVRRVVKVAVSKIMIPENNVFYLTSRSNL